MPAQPREIMAAPKQTSVREITEVGVRAEGGRTQKAAQAGRGKRRSAAGNRILVRGICESGGSQDWDLMSGFADPSIYSTGTRIVAPRPRTHAQQVTRPDPPALLAGCCSILAFDPSNSSHVGIRGHLRMLPPQLLYTSS